MLKPGVAVGPAGLGAVKEAGGASGVAAWAEMIARPIVTKHIDAGLVAVLWTDCELLARCLRKPRQHFLAAVMDEIGRPAANMRATDKVM